MKSQTATPIPPLAALYVDFDNIYLGLGPRGRRAFAEHPERWVPQLGVTGLRFASRTVYLNPSPFQRFQEPFARAGFRVISCPSLTQQGKSGADLRLALDAAETLHSATRYDTYMLMSGDADFSHLANVLREAGRYVTVLSPMPVASAYRHTADTVVAGIEFNKLLNLPPEDGAPGAVKTAPSRKTAPQRTPPSAQGPAAAAVHQLVEQSDVPVPSAKAAHVALAADPTLGESSWDGVGTFLTWVGVNVEGVECTNRSGGWLWIEGRHDTGGLFAEPEPAVCVKQRPLFEH